MDECLGLNPVDEFRASLATLAQFATWVNRLNPVDEFRASLGSHSPSYSPRPCLNPVDEFRASLVTRNRLWACASVLIPLMNSGHH